MVFGVIKAILQEQSIPSGIELYKKQKEEERRKQRDKESEEIMEKVMKQKGYSQKDIDNFKKAIEEEQANPTSPEEMDKIILEERKDKLKFYKSLPSALCGDCEFRRNNAISNLADLGFSELNILNIERMEKETPNNKDMQELVLQAYELKKDFAYEVHVKRLATVLLDMERDGVKFDLLNYDYQKDLSAEIMNRDNDLWWYMSHRLIEEKRDMVLKASGLSAGYIIS